MKIATANIMYAVGMMVMATIHKVRLVKSVMGLPVLIHEVDNAIKEPDANGNRNAANKADPC